VAPVVVVSRWKNFVVAVLVYVCVEIAMGVWKIDRKDFGSASIRTPDPSIGCLQP
jgi:hypothetical protein